MQKVRHYAVRGTSHDCPYCETMGFAAPETDSQLDPSFPGWLENAGYSHVVFGCGANPQDLIEEFEYFGESNLIPIFVRHKTSGIDPLTNTWLVSDEIPSLYEGPSPTFIWIPRKTKRSLADQARAFPKELREHFFIQWPHPKFLKAWGWTWPEVLREQEFLAHAFPYLSWRLPPGWDLFNPEVDDDLELEPRPHFTRDERPAAFRPEVSIVVPTYNNLIPLRSTVVQALKSLGPFEVLVADDGSDDGTREWFLEHFKSAWPKELVYLGLDRPRPREMGKGGFRAGIARNSASVLARGRILLFLDSDILIPDNFVNELIAKHESYDLVQATRLQFKNTAPLEGFQGYERFAPLDLEPLNETWETFQRRLRPWDELAHKWKFVSTFCLSIKRAHFFRLGAFRRSFDKYGFEDTDLGYRAAQAGLKFHRSQTPVYHFKHFKERSEYRHSARRKQDLLRQSARIFFLNNPDSEIVTAIPKYLRESPVWRTPWT
jgi:glycosyltransferase involved in cell wall biosynthesis